MKKVLIVTDAWRPQVNGVVSCYEKIAALLRKRAYEVSIVHPGMFRTIALPGYSEIRLALFPRRKLRKIITEVKPDAIHIAVEGPLGIAARALCREMHIPFTTCYHTHFQMYLGARGLRFLVPIAYSFLRWFHNSGAKTMVATESLKEVLEKHGFKNVVLWPLGVDTDLFKRSINADLPPLQKPVFVYFGRLAPEKSAEEFFTLNLPGTKLVIGDGPQRAALEKKYGSSVLFVGYKHGQELVDWLSLGDVCIFPSRTETFGLVALEALACGMPVAAHNVMGPRDIITDGVDGYLSENLSDAALKCLSLSQEACRTKALQYSWDSSTDTFIRHAAQISWPQS
ncbi:glycosyltransferase family 1 protein [Candidatus Parcubacteria bacterium]|nr:MAG: glycosyltransferase family 1 protein [Candidatus Parcubacteria bacterium]